MAIDSKSLTVDYKTLQAIPFRDRRALLYSSYADQINSALTPGQRANLFPSYYQRDAAAAKSALTGASGMLGGSGAANRERTGAGVGFSNSNTVEGQPEKKGPPAITASEFRAVEANPFLAGYADKTRRSTGSGVGVKVPGVGDLKDGRHQRMKMVYDSFASAGFSHKQSLALTAEVGRENGFQEKYMFGTHSDPYNNATNLGMLSMQGSRLKALKEHLAAEGRFDASGNLIADQDTMNSMAKFYMTEMKTSEKTKMTEAFLANPDIDAGEAARLLGKGYIRWRYDDPRYAHHHGFRDQYYSEIDNITSDFANNTEQTTAPDAMSVVQEVASQTASAAELVEKDKSVVSEQSLVDEAQETATARKEPITPELKEVLQYAAEESGSGIEVEVFSGGQMSKAEALSKGGSLVEIEGKKYWKLPNGEIVGTGSVRHNDGHAADIRLKVKDENGNYRYLSARNKEDRKIMSDFIKSARKYGAQGIGSGEGYMGDTGIHVGTVRRPDLDYTNKEYGAPKGAEAIWDSDAWARQAFAEGQKEAEIFEKSGGMIALRKQREEKIAKQKEADQQKLAEETEVQKEQPVSKVTFTEESGASLLPESHPFSMTKEKKERIKAAQTQTAAAVVEEPQTATTTEEPQSQTTPIKTMAQGGIVPSYGENEIVTRAPTSGEVIQRTKISEYGSEQVKVEPISKMKAEALTPVKNDLDVAPQMNEDQQKPAMQRSSMTASKIPSSPYSNITSEIKKPTATALRAALQIRMGNTAMGDYVA